MAEWKCAKFNKDHVTDLKLICKERHFINCFDIPSSKPRPLPVVYNSCLGNEEAGMRNRYLKSTPDMRLNMEVFQQCLVELLSQLQIHFTAKMDVNEFLNTKSGAKGQRYRKAAEELLQSGLDVQRDTTVDPFIKSEKYFVDGKPPRLIYPRNIKFNILYALYVVPLEHALVKLPQVCKGKNFAERGLAFSELVFGEHYGENDMSKFESSQRPELYDLVQKQLFDALYPNDELLDKLYEIKMHKFGRTMNGAKWSAYGMMASGEMDTGCFNTIFNWLACRYFEVINGYGRGNFLVDGDDSVLRIPRGATPINTFTDFGFDAKFFIRYDYHDVEFCSSKFVQCAPGVFYQTQDINKVFASVPNMINPSFDRHLGDYYGSLGQMYSILYEDFPVLSDFAHFLKTASTRAMSTKLLEDTGHWYPLQAMRSTKPTFGNCPHSILVDLSMCFSIDISELCELIKFFRNNHLDFGTVDSDVVFKSRDRKLNSSTIINSNFNEVRLVGKIKPRPKMYRNP